MPDTTFMELEPIIGLEIHVQLTTRSKMFCSCANIFGDVKPNSAICPICLGYPGTLPVPNRQAIEWTQVAGAALGCKLAKHSRFDRKSYFYPDLPKGYQISQYDQPFCGEGQLKLMVDGREETVGIERIHLEEDAAKNTHPSTGSGQVPKGADYTLVDFNRAGTPLMEIVTKPDIRSPKVAKAFLQELQRIMRALGISDADMEKGQMRCDANISLREKGSKNLNPKTEIKNINSFKFVEKALQHEIERQTAIWQERGLIKWQSTRAFDAKTQQTVAMRTKEEAADYRYFPEPDIPPFVFREEELEQRRIDVPELPLAKQNRFVSEFGISSEQARLLADDRKLADFFEKAVSEIWQLDNDRDDIQRKDRKILSQEAANIALRQIRKIAGGEPLKITPANFAEVVVGIHTGEFGKHLVTQLLEEMQRTGGDPDHIMANMGADGGGEALAEQVEGVIKENGEAVAKVKAGKESALQFLVGQVMKKTKGRADPAEVMKLLKGQLDK